MYKITDMHEVFIYGKDTSVDTQYEILQDVIKEIPGLLTDDKFHFLYENKYFLIRFDGVLEEKIKSGLSKLGYKYSYHNEWDEEQEIVKDNLLFFSKYLNMISMLSITTNDKPIELYERIIHLAFEAFAYQFYVSNNSVMPNLEAKLLNHMAFDRAFIDGYYIGMNAKERENDTTRIITK